MGFEGIKRIHRRNAEARERLRQVVMNDVFQALEKLSEEVSFQDVYLFGSLSKPYRFWESSDVDIAFKALDKDRLCFTISFLSRQLGRDVNVLPIEEIHFREKILREGIRWKKK